MSSRFLKDKKYCLLLGHQGVSKNMNLPGFKLYMFFSNAQEIPLFFFKFKVKSTNSFLKHLVLSLLYSICYKRGYLRKFQTNIII